MQPAVKLRGLPKQSTACYVFSAQPTLGHILDPWHPSLVFLHGGSTGPGEVFPLLAELLWNLPDFAADEVVMVPKHIRPQACFRRLRVAAVACHHESDLWSEILDLGLRSHVHLEALSIP